MCAAGVKLISLISLKSVVFRPLLCIAHLPGTAGETQRAYADSIQRRSAARKRRDSNRPEATNRNAEIFKRVRRHLRH